eukprot:301940-Lingulodinium_polyedra.AAC.1
MGQRCLAFAGPGALTDACMQVAVIAGQMLPRTMDCFWFKLCVGKKCLMIPPCTNSMSNH